MMKYFREYPWGFQLLLFLLMVFTMVSAAMAILNGALLKLLGVTASSLMKLGPNSPPAHINAAMIRQGVGSIFLFMLPALLFAYLTHPRPRKYLGLLKAGKPMQILLSVMVMLGAMPVLAGMSDLIGKIDFGADVKASQQQAEDMTRAFLSVPDGLSFIRAIIVVGVIPAVGEELFFRGILMRLARKRSRSMTAPILFTALVFAYAHTNIYGYLSIFLAGALLGGIYYLTGSIWCSIIAHFVFNSSQVVLAYLGNSNAPLKAFMNGAEVPIYFVLGGIALFSISFFLLLKNKTPLPADWTSDFDPGEEPSGTW